MPTYNQSQNNPGYLIMYTVKGEEGVNTFPVGPGQRVLLIDSENAVIYVKSANALGQINPLEIYDLKFRQPPQPETPASAPAISKDEITGIVNDAVKAAMHQYFPQINFND